MDSFNKIMNLYETRKIKQLDTAKNLIVKLSTSRGTGKKSTINKISKISKGTNNIKKVNPIMRPITKPKSKKFHITANIDSTIEYISSMKKAWKNKVNHKYQSMSKTIEAENEDQAKQEYIDQVKMDLESDYNKGPTIINDI